MKVQFFRLEIDLTLFIAGGPLPEEMIDDHISVISATFEMFHTEELTSSALFISQQELVIVESKGHEIFD